MRLNFDNSHFKSPFRFLTFRILRVRVIYFNDALETPGQKPFHRKKQFFQIVAKSRCSMCRTVRQ